jgi:hypothetical protein
MPWLQEHMLCYHHIPVSHQPQEYQSSKKLNRFLPALFEAMFLLIEAIQSDIMTIINTHLLRCRRNDQRLVGAVIQC